MKITKGEMIVEEDSDGQLWICPEGDTNLVCEICQAEDESGNIITTDGDRANAQLIAEAFNVANETGKSPRQLADENKELKESNYELVEILSEITNTFDSLFDFRIGDTDLISKAKNAINQTTKQQQS